MVPEPASGTLSPYALLPDSLTKHHSEHFSNPEQEVFGCFCGCLGVKAAELLKINQDVIAPQSVKPGIQHDAAKLTETERALEPGSNSSP